MDNQVLKNIQQNLVQSNIKPEYADEIMVAHTVKAGKDEKGKIRKEGHMHLIFLDMTTQKPVSKVVISPITARGLVKALSESVQKLEKELNAKGLPKKAHEATSTDYIR